MKERIEILMRAEGLTSVKFAEILSVQPSNISHILSGRNNPSYDFILKLIERFPDVNTEWLLTGKGAIYKSNIEPHGHYFTDVTADMDAFHDSPSGIALGSERRVSQSEVISRPSLVSDETRAGYSVRNDLNSDVYNSIPNTPKSEPSHYSRPIAPMPLVDPTATSDALSDAVTVNHDKQVKKIILFYTDNTFEVYNS